MLNLKWTSDQKAESDFGRMAVAWEKVDVPIKSIDWKESQINGARIASPLVRDLIEDYKTGFMNGDAFPMPVVASSAVKGYYVVLSGNQRTTALRELVDEKEVAQSVEIPCYLVKTDDRFLREIIARSANVAHGGRSSKDERLAHAVYCVRSLGMSSQQASKLFMVAPETINLHVRAEQERKELAQAGIDTSSMANTAIDVIRRIPDKAVKHSLCHVVNKFPPTVERLRVIVNSVCNADSTNTRLKKVKAFADDMMKQQHAAGKRNNGQARDKVPLRPQRDKMISMMTRLNAFLEHGPNGEPYDCLASMQFTGGDDTEMVRQLWSSIERHMKIIMRGVAKCAKTPK